MANEQSLSKETMAKRAPAPTSKPAQLTPQQIRAAVPKLERRVSELKGLNINALTETDYADKLDDLQRRIDDTLVDIFGHDTVDYRRYSIGPIDESPLSMVEGRMPLHKKKPYIERGRSSAISTLESAISSLKERLQYSGETAAARAINAYLGLVTLPP
jgi:hypothetical protein